MGFFDNIKKKRSKNKTAQNFPFKSNSNITGASILNEHNNYWRSGIGEFYV